MLSWLYSLRGIPKRKKHPLPYLSQNPKLRKNMFSISKKVCSITVQNTQNQKPIKATAQKGDATQVFYTEWGHNNEISSAHTKANLITKKLNHFNVAF